MAVAKSTNKSTTKSNSLAAETTILDPFLSSLFSSSSGPVKVITKAPNTTIISQTTTKKRSAEAEPETSSEEETEKSQSEGKSVSEDERATTKDARPRKRRRQNQEDDLETSYMNKLMEEEEKEQQQRQRKHLKDIGDEVNDSDSSASNDLEDLSASDLDSEDESSKPKLPVHESLQPASKKPLDKTTNTVFLSNISIEAIQSKTARKQLITHLKSALSTSSEDTKSVEKLTSLRFRSTAFARGVGPKRAAYAKKELMSTTTKSTNAYVVLSSESAARKVALRLNGTVILDRHMGADWLGKPRPHDHKRSVFVGNLNFVDEETVEGDDGENKRTKAKLPADAEEGLWTHFSKCGKVENVRVVRDKATRIGKGFGYVQFEDENGVEKALLLDEKKFPPLLPRKLRVTRAKRIMKKDQRDRNQGRMNGRSNKNNSNNAAGNGGAGGRKGSNNPNRVAIVGARSRGRISNGGRPEGVIFEGHRASNSASSSRDKKTSSGPRDKKKSKVRPTTRSSRRGADFRASGGKKKRDT